MSGFNLQDPQDLYSQAKRYITEYVAKKGYRQNDKLPTNHEFAKMMGVSALTVQRAIASLAKEGLVFTRRGCGTFLCGEGISTDTLKETGNIACVIPTIMVNSAAATILELDNMVFDTTGHHLVVCNTNWDLNRELRILDSLLEKRIDALVYQINARIWWRPVFIDSINKRLQSFRKSGVPVIMLDDVLWNDCDIVVGDYKRMYHLLLRHLADLGHKKLLYVGYKKIPVPRMDHFLQAARELGLEKEVRCSLATDDEVDDASREALEPILSEGWPFTAIVASTDGLALSCYKHLASQGIKCPENVSIVGVDNMECVSVSDIHLTTCWAEPQKIAEQIKKLITARLANHGNFADMSGEKVEVEPVMLVRQSTGPVKRQD